MRILSTASWAHTALDVLFEHSKRRETMSLQETARFPAESQTMALTGTCEADPAGCLLEEPLGKPACASGVCLAGDEQPRIVWQLKTAP